MFVADLHVHTVASGHAFSTPLEIASVAREKGLEIVALLDHGPALPGGAHPYHFSNLIALPRRLEGVLFLRGAEANIINHQGELDLDEKILSQLDLVGVAFHSHCGYENQGKVLNTEILLKAMESPYVQMVVHPDNPAFPLDLEVMIEAAQAHQVLLEFNNYSLLPNTARQGDLNLSRTYLEKIAQAGAFVAVNSDAHFAYQVGECQAALSLLEEVSFPCELIVNSSLKKVSRLFKMEETLVE
jgi:putative hydrolase